VFRGHGRETVVRWRRFGDTRKFAIDVHVWPTMHRYVWADLRWWVGGRPLKHEGDVANLCDSATWGEKWIEDEDLRQVLIAPMTPEEAMYHFCEYQYSRRVVDEPPYWCWPREERLCRHATVLDPIGVDALMDWWMVVSIRTPHSEWILARDQNTRELIDHHIPVGETRRVVQEFCTWVRNDHCKRPEPPTRRGKRRPIR